MNTTTPNLIDDVRAHLTSGVSEVFRTMLALETTPAAVLDTGTRRAALWPLVSSSAMNGIVCRIQVTAAFTLAPYQPRVGLVAEPAGGT
jgi:hypothetical protein